MADSPTSRRRRAKTAERLPLPDQIALVLQGGGALGAEHPVSIVHLIYRKHGWEGSARDFEFSRDSMEHNWREGRAALAETMRHDALLARNIVDGRTAAFDLAN